MDGDIRINQATGTVTGVAGDSWLSPQILERIVDAVQSAMDERQLREKRSKADTSVTAGVVAEQEQA